MARAYHDATCLRASPAHDVWSLGVLCYELVTRVPAFGDAARLSAVFDCAHGAAPYPWERPPHAQPEAWRRSRLRKVAQSCLQRDPAQRMSAERVRAELRRFGSSSVSMRRS